MSKLTITTIIFWFGLTILEGFLYLLSTTAAVISLFILAATGKVFIAGLIAIWLTEK